MSNLSLRHRLRRLRDDRRGLALPLALVGLILVSVVLTTAVVTSSTELAMGNAHRSAAGSLYTADAGLQAYIAANANMALVPADGFDYAVPGSGQRVRIRVEEMLREAPNVGPVVPVEGGTRQTTTQNVTFAIRAEPLRGAQAMGRPVLTLVTQTQTTQTFTPTTDPAPPPVEVNTSVNSAITLGGSLHVNGNAFWVSGRKVQGDTCASGGGVQAVERSRNSNISTNNHRHMQNFVGAGGTTGWNAIIDSGLNRDTLVYRTLGLKPGQTLDDLAAALPDSLKWGPMFGRPSFSGTMRPTHGVAVVDANRGTVDLNSGAGMIIILNGNVRLKGNTHWKGTIIVEGTFNLSGTPTVEGALISLSMRRQGGGFNYNYVELSDNGIGNGNVLVQFNQCEINKAQSAFEKAVEEAMPDTPPTDPEVTLTLSTANSMAWFEVVR